MTGEYGLDIVRVKLVREGRLEYGNVSGPSDLSELISRELSSYDREIVAVINLKCNGDIASILNLNLVSMGTINASLVHAREVFKSAILSNANHMVMLHNHPSGNATPSREDLAVTDQMVSAGRLLGIEVSDHVIICGITGEMYSLREHGQMPNVEGKTFKELLAMAEGTKHKEKGYIPVRL